MRLEQLITGNDQVQQCVASEQSKEAVLAIAPAARRAVQLEILPQIEENVVSSAAAKELCEDTKKAVEAAFKTKDARYTRLITHKGIEQGDGQYMNDLLLVLDEWLRNTLQTHEEARKSTQDDNIEVVVKLDPKDIINESEVQIKDVNRGPQIKVDADTMLDLAKMRL